MVTTPLYSFRLNVSLKAQLEAIAKREGRTLSYIIDRACAEYVQRNTKPERTKR